MNNKNVNNHLKSYGFFIPNTQIYGGLANSWDLGPNGVQLERKLKTYWWKYFVDSDPLNIGADSQIITHPKILEASGHLKNFHDWLVECLKCQKRYRLDSLLNEKEFSSFLQKDGNNYEIEKECPECHNNKLTKPKKFNLLLTTDLGTVENKKDIAYLRPETCQNIYINFPIIQRSTHKKLPFGVGQIGKSFRNEITLQRGIFRTREFKQAELEFFSPLEESEKWWEHWNKKAWFFLNNLVNKKENIKKVILTQDELPHYAIKTTDLYFQYHFGWGELCSISNRGDYDLKNHGGKSGKKLVEKNQIIPQVIEISFGIERLMLAILESSYQEETLVNSTRTVLKIPFFLTPYFVAIIPLDKNLKKIAYDLYLDLLKVTNFSTTYEESSSIGKSYRRQDAIGTFYCVTIDFQTEQDNSITIRKRDDMSQQRINLKDLKSFLEKDFTDKYQKIL